jgi:hypothetical protein
MGETTRVQRWRDANREKGLKALTIWFTVEEELRLKDMALQWHCSPSAVLQRIFGQFNTSTAPQNGSTPDTLRIRELIREELTTLPLVTDMVTEDVTATLAGTCLPWCVSMLKAWS